MRALFFDTCFFFPTKLPRIPVNSVSVTSTKFFKWVTSTRYVLYMVWPFSGRCVSSTPDPRWCDTLPNRYGMQRFILLLKRNRWHANKQFLALIIRKSFYISFYWYFLWQSKVPYFGKASRSLQSKSCISSGTASKSTRCTSIPVIGTSVELCTIDFRLSVTVCNRFLAFYQNLRSY